MALLEEFLSKNDINDISRSDDGVCLTLPLPQCDVYSLGDPAHETR